MTTQTVQVQQAIPSTTSTTQVAAMASKRKLSSVSVEPEEPVDPSEELMFLCLGGGNEVGRSCHIIQYKGKTIMLDAGMHPAYKGFAALPYFDEFDLSTVDIFLVSHFHLDHAAAVPYVLSKTNFRGRIFMTHPTKAIYKWLIQDSTRVGNTSSSDQPTQLYTEADHFSTFPRIETIDYYTTHTISSIRITPYPAGHVLGAAMFLIEIAGLKILFTGDYSREEDRHLIPAEVPKNVKVDVLITESTFGIASHEPRLEREAALMKSITSTLNRGGRVLMPVFALGRAQELLLILDEYWGKHPEYQKIPIFYASNLARKCMTVFQAYLGSMNANIKRIFQERMAEAEQAGLTTSAGPWDFRFVRSLKNLERFDDSGGSVVLASPGMLQSGISRELLERWASNERNCVIMTGYSVEGTMGKQIALEPDTIPAIMGNRGAALSRTAKGGGEDDKPMIPRKCSVVVNSFAAHVSGVENQAFIEEIQAPVVILVHGEKHNMNRLKSKLLSLNARKAIETKIYSPANTEELRIPFRADKTAKVVGKLAQITPSLKLDELEEEHLLSGVLVQNDFKLSLMAPEDLREYAGLTTTTIVCRQRLTLSAAGIDLIRWALEGTFGSIDDISSREESQGNGHVEMNGHDTHEAADEEIQRKQQSYTYLVMGCVKVKYESTGEVTVEWEGNVVNDGIADAVFGCLLTVESSPAAVKQSSRNHNHDHSHDNNLHADISPQERFERLCMFLEAQFGPALTPIMTPKSFFTSALPKIDESKTSNGDIAMKSEPTSSDDEETSAAEADAAEIARLQSLGIPVPGIEIKMDKYTAKIWLETLEVECASQVFAQRVKAVVDRAVETVAPLWASAGSGKKV